MSLLPDVPTPAAYRAVFRDDAVWRPAVQTIAERHGLAGADLRRPAEGSNVVFLAGNRRVIKLFAPIYSGEHHAERDLLVHVAGRLKLAVPEVVAEGELEGWPYLILTRIAGVPLNRVYDSFDARARLRAAEQLGALAAAIHTLPFGPLADQWTATFAELRASCVDRRAAQGLGAACLAALPAQLAALAPAPDTRPVLVHADLTGEHVFVDDSGQVVALIDFADALVADPRYEWPAIGAFALQSEREPIRAALGAYGFPAAAVNAALADILTAFTLLHRYGNLHELPGTAARRPSDWHEAVEMLFPIG